jgi:transaldolase
MKRRTDHDTPLAREIRDFVRDGFTPHYQELRASFPARPRWAKLRALRTELWLDTGDPAAISDNWTREFTALTTNNTLLNKEIQKGTYDDFIVEAAGLLKKHAGLDDYERKLEMAFMLNARHALKLVEKFDAYVSVEEHTDLANDLFRSVEYARRFYSICPERFIVKIPFSPAGVLATRKVASEGIPVNHTLGFSARQNYIVTRLAQPSFVNVFLGRLNSVVADNGLGDGSYVGEKATLASQAAVRELRNRKNAGTRQIGASLRSGDQVENLAGIDVMTMPTKVAGEFLDMNLRTEEIEDASGNDYEPGVNANARELGVDTLWEIEDRIRECVDSLEKEDLEAFLPDDLVQYFADHLCADVLVKWSAAQSDTSRKEGKIPDVKNWGQLLMSGEIGLDSLMNLAGLNSFATDQEEMDKHVMDALKG